MINQNLEPETEANSSTQEDGDANTKNNLSAISFTDSEEAKGIGSDMEMFPNMDQATKGNKEFQQPADQKKEAQKGNKLELTANEFTPSDGSAPMPAGQNQFYK